MPHSPAADDSARAKAEMRSHLRRKRRELSPSDVTAAGEKVVQALLAALPARSPTTVTAYFPLDVEPGGDLPDALLRAGHRVLLPVLCSDMDLDWALYTGVAELTARGLREPAGPRLGRDAVASADVVILPGQAVGEDGARLGQGGGCYDRALARVEPGVPTPTLLHDGEWPQPVPWLPHDQKVNAVVTPSDGYVRLG